KRTCSRAHASARVAVLSVRLGTQARKTSRGSGAVGPYAAASFWRAAESAWLPPPSRASSAISCASASRRNSAGVGRGTRTFLATRVVGATRTFFGTRTFLGRRDARTGLRCGRRARARLIVVDDSKRPGAHRTLRGGRGTQGSRLAAFCATPERRLRRSSPTEQAGEQGGGGCRRGGRPDPFPFSGGGRNEPGWSPAATEQRTHAAWSG